MNNNWARDLMGGYTFGNVARDKFDTDVAKRKAEKVAGTIASEQDKKLFDVEDKGGLGGWLWDKMGIGDPPKKGVKGSGSPATSEKSDLKNAVGAGLQAFADASQNSAPTQLSAPDAGTFTPVPTAQFAAPTPLVAVPAMSPVEQPQLSNVQQALLKYGIKPNKEALA